MSSRMLTLKSESEALALIASFQISGHVFKEVSVVRVELFDGAHAGRGEAAGVYYLGDDVANMTAAIEAARSAIESGVSREDLRQIMPAGGGRNAIDAALWELEAKTRGLPMWRLAGLAEAPRPVVTTFTIGADEPGEMARQARAFNAPKALKLKLTGELDLDIARVEAVRAAMPGVWMGVDANQGFVRGDLPRLLDALVAADVQLLEQPLARGQEADLEDIESPIAIAADESALTLGDLPGLMGRFDAVNIKLDKCGGLTEGLAMARAARALGLKVMVGNMMGSSLAMAPAFILAQLCDIVDLDGPIYLANDPPPVITYDQGYAWCDDTVWGSPA